MQLHAVIEYNEKGCLIYAENVPGACARGKTQQEALEKLPVEARRCLLWASGTAPAFSGIEIVQRQRSALAIEQADTDILFASEKGPLTAAEYTALRDLALRSARDFHTLYSAFPDPDQTNLAPRSCFYGQVPRTAREMYRHTNEVTSSYLDGLAEIQNLPDIYENRAAAFRRLEQTDGYLENRVYTNLWDEPWCLKKALRRFLWHDRLHAKALYRLGRGLFFFDVPDVFCFDSRA